MKICFIIIQSKSWKYGMNMLKKISLGNIVKKCTVFYLIIC